MAPRIPSTGGEGLSPPRTLAQEAAAAAAAAAEGGIPPPQLPDGLLEAADVPPRWGFSWLMPDEADDDDDPFDFLNDVAPVVQPGDGHHLNGFAAEDGALDAVDAAEPYVFAPEDGPPDAVDHEAYAEDEALEDEDYGWDLAENEDDYVPMFNYHEMMQPADSGEEEEKEDSGDELYLPETWSRAYGADACHDGEMPLETFHIRSMANMVDIMDCPLKYSNYIIVSCRFGQVDQLLNGVDTARVEQEWQWVGNMGHLEQAVQLKSTILKLDHYLSRISEELQDRQVDAELAHSLRKYLPKLAANRVSLQPMNICYYADAISAAVKVLIDSLPGDGDNLQWTTSIPGRIDYKRINACISYIRGRILSLDGEDVTYPDDIFPNEDEVQEEGEEEDEVEEEEEEEEVVEEEDELEDDDSPSHFVRIRDMTYLTYLKSSRHQYYIIQSVCYADVWDMLHGIRDLSEKNSWLWVGNMDRLWQAFHLRDTIALLYRELNKVCSFVKDNKCSRIKISLSGFVEQLRLACTSLQSANIRYFTDAIAVEVRALIASLSAELPKPASSDDLAIGFPHLPNIDDVGGHVQRILQWIQEMDHEYIDYPVNITPPEVLPPLPGPPPVPLPSP